MEILAPEPRGYGYTTRPLYCLRPDLGPMVGYARTATICSDLPGRYSPEEMQRRRISYYTYVEKGGPLPSIIVIQDVSDSVGKGSFWGEVNSNVHKGLGAVGLVTNGSIRDVPDMADGFQMLAGMVLPSHAWVHACEWGVGVVVHGMAVADGDLIHADQHGAVVIPHDVAGALPDAVGPCRPAGASRDFSIPGTGIYCRGACEEMGGSGVHHVLIHCACSTLHAKQTA